MSDIDDIRKRDAESGALWFTGPVSFTAQSARDRRALLVKYDRVLGLLDRACARLEMVKCQPGGALDKDRNDILAQSGWKGRAAVQPSATGTEIRTMECPVCGHRVRSTGIGAIYCGPHGQQPSRRMHEIGSPAVQPAAVLPRYGIQWNGPHSPIATPMDDGYWTPWHLAMGLPSMTEADDDCATDNPPAAAPAEEISCKHEWGSHQLADGSATIQQCKRCGVHIVHPRGG